MIAVDAYFELMAKHPDRAAREARRLRGQDTQVVIKVVHEPQVINRLRLTNERDPMTQAEMAAPPGRSRGAKKNWFSR